MKISKSIQKLAVLSASTFVMVLFQNCSKVDASLIPQSDSKAMGQSTDEGGATDPVVVPPDIGSTPDGEQGTGEEPESESSSAVAECDRYLKNQKNLVELQNDENIIGMAGNHAFLADQVAEVRSNQGSLKIIGKTEDALIETLEASGGNILVCNMDVAEIGANTHGNLIIVGGSVGAIDGFRGNLTIIDGDVGSVADFRGNLTVQGGKVAGKIDQQEGNLIFK